MKVFLELVTSILGQASFLVALVACIGLIAQKASTERVITGTLKSLLGMLLLSAGANVIVAMLTPMADIMAKAFNFQGIVPVNEAITALATTKFGGQMAIITVGGFFINLILARFTPLRYIFLSGHHILFIATVTTAMLFTLGLSSAEVLLYGSIISGIVMTAMPALSMPFMHKATKGAGFAMGHLATSGYVLSGLIGKVFGGDPEETDSEKMKFTGKLSFMRESLLLMGLGVALIYVLSAVVTSFKPGGPELLASYADTQNPIIWTFTQSFNFAVGVAIILQGVRMFVGEIVPAFRGISEKIVPDAIPALDCPAVFPYGEKSVLMGFLGYTVGLVLAMILLIVTKYPVIIIPILFHSFFMGGTAGIFGNSTGGRRGAFIGSAVTGFMNSCLQAVLYTKMAILGFEGTTFADTDFVLTGLTISLLGKNMVVVMAIFVALLVVAMIVEKKITRPLLSESGKAD